MRTAGRKKNGEKPSLDLFRFSVSDDDSSSDLISSADDNDTGTFLTARSDRRPMKYANNLEAPLSWKHARLIEMDYDIERQFRVSLADTTVSDDDSDTHGDDVSKSNWARRKAEYVKDPLGVAYKIPSTTASLDPASDTFNAGLFLATVHENLGYKDLCMSAEHLRKHQDEQNRILKKLVQNNFGRFISGIDKINSLFVEPDSTLFKSDKLDQFELQFIELLSQSQTLFDPLLEKREEADRIHQTLTLLKRLRFVFMLPSDIKQNIANGEFRKVVNDYQRAKHFSSRLSKSELFQSVFHEVQSTISGFRETLFHQLSDCSVPIEEQERIIGYLHTLDSEVDPSWFYLCTLHDHIARLVRDCMKEEGDKIHSHKRALSIIQRLNGIMMEHIPIFSKLSMAVMENRYHPHCSKRQRAPSQNTMRKDLTEKIEKLISIYASECRQILQSIDNGKSQQPWLVNCISEVINCCGILCESLDEQSTGWFLTGLTNFANELKHFAMVEMWERMNMEISKMYSLEDFNIIRGTSHTNLPLLLKKNLERMIDGVAHFVEQRSGVASDIQIFRQLSDLLVKSLLAFSDTLHELVFPFSALDCKEHTDWTTKGSEMHPYLGVIGSETWQQRFLIIMSNCWFMRDEGIKRIFDHYTDRVMAKDTTFTVDRRMKQIFSDGKEEKHISSRIRHGQMKLILAERNTQRQLFEMREVAKTVEQPFDNLDAMLLRIFVTEKSRKLGSIIGRSIHFGWYNWKQAASPAEVRPEIIELMLDLALTHFHSERVAHGHFTKRILGILGEKIAELFGEHVGNIDDLGSNGALQLEIELAFIQDTLDQFTTERAQRIIRSIVSRLHCIAQPFHAERIKKRVLDRARQKTGSQLSAFFSKS